jgi:signal transduction histidine kinase/DNA-binding response OmpR family regulator
VHKPWQVLALFVAAALAVALVLWSIAQPDIHPLLVGLPLALLTFLVADLWHRRRSQSREARYQQLLRHLPTRLRIRDPRGRLLIDNRPHEQDAAVLQPNLPLGYAEPPEPLSPISRRAWQGLREVLASGERQEMCLELPANAERAAQAYRQIFFPIFDGGQRITALGSLLIDETDLRATADALRVLTDDLEHQVRARTTELAEAKEQAERQAELQAEFMAHLSHEIRSPLSALIGLAHLARRSSRDARLDGYLDKLRKAAEHLLEIVNDVLDFSRLDAGRLPIAQVPFSPTELVWNVVDMIGESAREKGLAIGVELDAQIPASLHGDPLRVSQILINLASNAVKFTAHGRIDFRMRRLAGDAEHVRLRFEIEDSGTGIAAENIHLLFKPFSQLPGHAEQASGTGLGLAISARLASLMGGELGVRSAPGEGSLFFLELELRWRDGLLAEVGGAGATMPRRYAGHRVLLVDDDALMREVSAELLQLLGLQVCMAADGREALECLRNDADIVLVCMDLQMPNMDGLEATRQLRREWPDLPVIAMTGSTRDSDRQACRTVGMNDFLAKPVALNQLMAVLQRWLPAQAEPSAVAAEGLPLPAIAGLDQAAALERMLDNRDLYVRLLRRFLEETPTLPEQLREQLQTERPGEAAEHLHRFKSLAATLGAVELQALSGRLEGVLQVDGDPAEALAAFEAEFQRLYLALRKALEEV